MEISESRPWIWPRALRPMAIRLAFLLLPLAGFGILAGCNPASLAMLLVPFMDDKEPPRCKIANKEKETTIAIVTWFGNRDLQLWPELMPADVELSEKLAIDLRDRYTGNKEKVKIIPNAQVRSYQSKLIGDTWSPAEIGKKLKADKVIALEINALSLHEKSSYQQLFRGSTEIAVKVYELDKPSGEQVVFTDIYTRMFPREAPTDAGTSMQFRAAFITRVSRDLSRWFAAYSNDERKYDMDSD